MMEIVAPQAAKAGYAPDCWFSPDSCNKKGRPYPYMIFKNMEALQIDSVSKVIKAGDTVADILEGKNAGVFTIGILDGSSVIGLSEAEFEALSEDEKMRSENMQNRNIWMPEPMRLSKISAGSWNICNHKRTITGVSVQEEMRFVR